MTAAPTSSVIATYAVNMTAFLSQELFVMKNYAVQTVPTLYLELCAGQSKIYVIFQSTAKEITIPAQIIFICKMEPPVLKKPTAIKETALIALCTAKKSLE